MEKFDNIITRLREQQNAPRRQHVPMDIDERYEPGVIEYTRTRCVDLDEGRLAKNRLVAHNKSDPMSAPYHILRAKVLQQMRRNKWTTLGITAPTPEAGKSLTACNLAMSIAMQSSQTVLLVDMDLRKPTVAKYFGLAPEIGIHDYITGSAQIEDILIHPNLERLVLLPGTKPILNSSEEISSSRVADLVQELKYRYQARYVIFDLPPILVSDDVLVFLPYIDCSLMVIEDGRNTREEIEDAVESIGSNPLLGTVLNKCEQTRNTYGYYYGQKESS
ncbi:CpsD/CapB family tyrosine-protein kinase [Allohahella sp. A8]|uniref:CpsD/CapB family tyrosine-protein kinase n=1 Tax=Allohahella sp. A8 TaxID=3141461 RepID=UPI000C09DE5B|nr:exopolysaccharide biosynthesis protein [Hahellaceae bacterium]|tara:strand:- start:4775 stop:5602 length:828 start_codon:yes stop_codon:yes gene_type:complete